MGGVLVSENGLGQQVLEERLAHLAAVDGAEIGLLGAGAALNAVCVQGGHVVLHGLLAVGGEGVALFAGLFTQDGGALELGQGLVQEVVGVGGALLLVVGLLGGGLVGVVAHVDPIGFVLLGLVDVVVGDGVVVVGHFYGGELLVSHGGGGAVFGPVEEGVPDQKRSHGHGNDDADGPIQLCLAAVVLVGFVHDVCFFLLTFDRITV